ncbi:MAG: hypothetical protein JO252_29260 [Planctomycetaceae bacterium]|nr:hypothetical protein [Planctomycetaceae bacterium]
MCLLELVATNAKLRCHLFLLGLVAFFLSPLLRTGYFCDDVVQSILPGVFKIEGYSLHEYIWIIIIDSIKGGRFYPLQMVETASWFILAQTPVVHKAMVVAGVVSNVGLFALLVRRISKSAAFAAFAVCLVFPLFQLRTSFDPILAFFGLLQALTAGLFISLLALQIYLETGRARWMVLSVASHVCVLLLYEFTYVFFIVHLVLIGYARRAWSARVLTSLPFAVPSVLGVLASAVLRRLFVSDVGPLVELNRINKNPVEYLSTLASQTSSAFPLSYYLADPASLYPRAWDLVSVVRFLATAGGVTVFIGTLAACLACLRHLPSEADEHPPVGRIRLMALLGLLLGVLPAALISFSVRHQKIIRPGIPYTPIYLQYFGAGLLLAVGAWSLLSATRPGGSLRRRARIAMAILVAVIAGLTYRANTVVVDVLEIPRCSPRYNPVVGNMLGCLNPHRWNLETALHAGLLDNVPEHSVVLLSNGYPGWHDEAHSRYFYAMHCGKVLETVPMTPVKWLCWFHAKAGNTPSKPATPTPTYLVRDVCLGKESGYVVLSPEPARDGEGRPQPPEPRESREIRFFVRHPSLFRVGGDPAVMLVGRTVSPTGGADGSLKKFQGSDLSLVRSGRDWALFSLRGAAEAGRIDPNSLTPMIGPILASWCDGFDGLEVDAKRDTRRRWSDRRGVLVLHNVTGESLKVKVSMRLRSEGDAPLVLACGTSRSVINAGRRPVRFERELALAPGQNLVEIRPGGSPIRPYPEDNRALSFSMSDFKIRDVTRR